MQLGTKLLGTDVRIAVRLIWKTVRGKTLSRFLNFLITPVQAKAITASHRLPCMTRPAS